MSRIVHLSDLHHQLDWRLRSWWSTGWRGVPGRLELHGLGRLKLFSRAADEIRRLVDQVLALEPDHVVLTGDLSALGHADELEAVQQTLAPLRDTGRLVLVPGNHDRYTDAPGAREFERLFAGDLKSDLPEYADAHGYPFVQLQGEKFALVGLDSTRVSGWNHYFMGKVGAAQLGALARLLDDPRLVGRTILLLVHHGPWGPAGGPDWREAALLDGAHLLRVLHGHRVVLHHGHSHLRYWHPAEGGVPHQFGGGSSTEPGNAGFWLVEIDDPRTLEARAVTPGDAAAR